ncbi:MAG TPA: hypothetical protein VFC58_09420 [Desulfosporosinus sp.]|nr:hypothetical protein [Desulfosporosinus sp.]
MGIDFSHCEAHWSYSGFMSFRRRVAAEAGIDLDSMAGFSNTKSFTRWDDIKDDIEPLLNHSDCDGGLTPSDCAKVVPRLRELVSGWDDDDYDKINALCLAWGMEEALSKDVNFEFC